MLEGIKQGFAGNIEEGRGWEYDPVLGDVVCWDYSQENCASMIPICKVYYPQDVYPSKHMPSEEEARANARLIEHAPKMWDLLKFLYDSNMIDKPDARKELRKLLTDIAGITE